MADFDVVVVGGGLIGCASACYLAQAGARVLLLERGQINQGASGQNAGSLHFQLEHRLIQNMDQHARELEFYVGLARTAIEQWQELQALFGPATQLNMHGGLMVAETAEQTALLERKANIEQSQGLEVHLLDGDEARRQAPYLSRAIQAALLCPSEGHCNPRLLTPAFTRMGRGAGAEFRTQAVVQSVAREGKRWRLGVACGSAPDSGYSVTCDAVLNAAGAHAPSIAAMANLHLPLFPVALTMNVTEKVEPTVTHLVQHVGRKLSLKQADDGNLLIGGGWAARLRQTEGHWPDSQLPQISPDAVVENIRTAVDVVPRIRSLRLIRTWTGTTAITADQLPILGEVAQAPGFFVAAGGSGFTYGPTYARLISELILTGSTSYPLEPFSPQRFSGLNAFMGT